MIALDEIDATGEVEEEVTLPLENALQQLASLDHVTSTSSAGFAQVMVEMKSTYPVAPSSFNRVYQNFLFRLNINLRMLKFPSF